MADLGQAYVQIIPKAEGISGKISEALGGGAGEAGEKAGGLFSKGFGGKVAKGVAIGGAALAAGVAVGTKALASGIKATAEYGDNVDKMSQKLGLSSDAYQKWDYVLNLAGTEMSSMTTGLKTLTNQFQAAKDGNETSVKAFEQLGISMEEAANMSREDLFAAAIEGLQGMSDTTERAALANKLFGKSGQNLTPLFNQTAEQTQEQMDLAERYGMVMPEAAVKASAAFQDSVTTMQMTMTGLKNRMMAEFLPSVTQITDGLGKMFAGDMSGVDDIVAGLEGIGSKIVEMAPKIFDAGKRLLGQLLAGFAGNSGEIGEKIGTLVVKLVSALIKAIPSILKAGVKLVAGLAKGLIQGLPKILSAVGKITKQIISGLGSKIWSKVTQAANGIRDRFMAPINALRDKVKSVVDKIKGFFDFTTKTPHVKLPHFSISPAGWKVKDLLEGSIPHLSVTWNAKAENAPYMFRNATLFGAGERNDELLYGRAALMRDIREASGGHGDIIINLNYDANADATEMVRDIARGVQRYKMAGAF